MQGRIRNQLVGHLSIMLGFLGKNAKCFILVKFLFGGGRLRGGDLNLHPSLLGPADSNKAKKAMFSLFYFVHQHYSPYILFPDRDQENMWTGHPSSRRFL